MELNAWCGICGQSFRLAELIEGGFSGRCPRCGEQLAADYTPIATAAVHELLAAADGLNRAGSRLAEVAPHLHIDGRGLAAEITAALGDQ